MGEGVPLACKGYPIKPLLFNRLPSAGPRAARVLLGWSAWGKRCTSVNMAHGMKTEQGIAQTRLTANFQRTLRAATSYPLQATRKTCRAPASWDAGYTTKPSILQNFLEVNILIPEWHYRRCFIGAFIHLSDPASL